MSVTFSIHKDDKTSVAAVTDARCFYISVNDGAVVLLLWEEKIRWFRDQLNAYYPVEDDPKPCDFCDSLATTTEQDELGNDCRVCENHAEMLASKKPERVADSWYDEQKET